MTAVLPRVGRGGRWGSPGGGMPSRGRRGRSGRGEGPGDRAGTARLCGGSGPPAGRTISDEGPGPTETKRTCDVRSCLRRAFFTGTSSRGGARWGKGGRGGKATYEGAKSQIPNPKSQIPQRFRIWDLGFGISFPGGG